MRHVAVLFLCVAVAAVFWPVKNHGFINFDDDLYVTENDQVKQGLTADGITWAFQFNRRGYWQPFTWLSHMLDCELFGLNPTGHHLTNLAIHILNASLLFLILTRTTGCLYRSAFVAALFSLHPLNVDSVAWVAERKNVLSTCFWLLTLLFYIRYVKEPSVSRYAAALLSFVLGLMTKPMLITLPFVLLLLDFWPLARMQDAKRPSHFANQGVQPHGSAGRSGISHLLLEKVPFLALSLVSVILSITSIQHINNMVSPQTVPMSLRIQNALISYLGYIAKMLWPQELAVYYPFPDQLPLWQVAGSATALLTATILVLKYATKKPYLALGWFWYLGTLFPVIGIVQGGLWPAMADRWAYVPLIGLFVIIAFGVPDLMFWPQRSRRLLTAGGLAILICCAVLTRIQLGHWIDSRSLFEHALAVNGENSVAHNNLGNALLEQRDIGAAMEHFQVALRLKPQDAKIHNNIGNALVKDGKFREAIPSYTAALNISPVYTQAHNNLGVALTELGRLDEAVVHFQKALAYKPRYVEAHNNLGIAYRRQGKLLEAATQYLKALEVDPELPDAYNGLGVIMSQLGKYSTASSYFRQALEKDPRHTKALENLKQISKELAGSAVIR